MRPETPKLLEDVRDSSSFILESVSRRSFEDYTLTVERNYEIIGEALNRIKKNDPETAQHIGDFGRIVAFRNVLAHSYDMVDNEVVWNVTQKYLPTLLKAVQDLLGKAGQ